MRFLRKMRYITIALLPILVIVLFVHLFFYKIETSLLIKFFCSAVVIIIGESLFLTGVDSTIIPMGELMVGTVNRFAKLVVFLIFASLFGFFATIAEPDVSVFTEQLLGVKNFASRIAVLFCIGAGVGIAVAFCLIRIIKNIPLKYVYVAVFAIIFLMCSLVKPEYIALAFDAGGATTGIISVPFLLAIASGISAKFSKNKNNQETFGMVGLAALGPIISVLIMLLICQNSGNYIKAGESMSLILSVLKNTVLAIVPLAVVFIFYDLIMIKLPLKKKAKFMVGLLVTAAGLFMFMFGIDFGFTPMGTVIGKFLAWQKPVLVILICAAMGFVLTFSEPAVIVLAKQVRNATKGSVPYLVVVFGIAISMALAVTFAALRILYSVNFFYIILIGYSIALLLMFFVDTIFTGMAFDSGGVASGPMTSAFLLPLMIALAAETTDALDGFGLIGIVAMTPIVVIQIIGLFYKVSVLVNNRKLQRKAIMVAFTSDMYSNIDKLEMEYNKMKEKKNVEKRQV